MPKEMKYWLFITDVKGWTTLRKKQLILLPEKKEKNVKKNNKVVVYVQGHKLGGHEVSPPRIRGIFTVISDPSQPAEDTTTQGGKQYAIKVKPTLVLKEDFLAFRELILELQFIENKDQWQSYLKEHIIEIPKHDYNYIKIQMEQR